MLCRHGQEKQNTPCFPAEMPNQNRDLIRGAIDCGPDRPASESSSASCGPSDDGELIDRHGGQLAIGQL
jgi:hypothetical protein